LIDISVPSRADLPRRGVQSRFFQFRSGGESKHRTPEHVQRIRHCIYAQPQCDDYRTIVTELDRSMPRNDNSGRLEKQAIENFA
jgi:hypothetical protein